jgi:sugar/nucleoside kinase (ribokinase family)
MHRRGIDMAKSAVVVGTAGAFDIIIGVDRLPNMDSPKAWISRPPEKASAFGGCGFNVAVGLARLGGHVSIISPVGDDFASSGYPEHLATAGVDQKGLFHLQGHPSSRCYMIRSPDDHAYVLIQPIAESLVESYPVAGFEEMISNAAIVALTPDANAFSVGLARIAFERRVPILLSGLAGLPVRLEAARTLWSLAAMAVVNEQEFAAIIAAFGEKPAEMTVYVTAGARGSVVLHGCEATRLPAVGVQRVVEQTGAGDAYTAGVLAGTLMGLSRQSCGLLASVAASFAIETYGAQAGLPTLADVKARYLQMFGSDFL